MDGAQRHEPTAELDAVRDPERLAAVERTGLLDAAAGEAWDELTSLAARLLDAPLAFMTLVDAERSFWLSCVGVSGQRQNRVEESFCQYVIADAAPLLVDDTRLNPRTATNPAVRDLGVRAWAGYPVLDGDGQPLGSFCVVDSVPRAWSREDAVLLEVLSRAASAHLRLVTAAKEQEVAQRRAEGLAALAERLLTTETAAELVDVVLGDGLALLGADGGSLATPDGAGALDVVLAGSVDDEVRREYATIPAESALPSASVLASGERSVLPDRAAGLAAVPELARVYEAVGHHAQVVVPLQVLGRRLGTLAAFWMGERRLDDDELDLLDAVAAQCAQALRRIQSGELLRASASLSERLQRTLLSEPVTARDLDVAVRYVTAVRGAHVGGDWHDAFHDDAGGTLVSVGDVMGHDDEAAAGMAQLRTLLRGLALSGPAGTATLLTRLDAAVDRLGIRTMATAVLARVGPPDSAGVRDVAWSSAGHLPVLLRRSGGRVELLAGPPELVLGLDPAAERTEHAARLGDDDTLLLCTDGLVERRGEDLDTGLDRLAAVFGDVGGAPVEQVCDALLARMVGDERDDDVALLVLRGA